MPRAGASRQGAGCSRRFDDCARFGQMLLNGGEFDGVRLLGRKTVESMRSNHLLFLERPTTDNGADGFGLGGAVRRHERPQRPRSQSRPPSIRPASPRPWPSSPSHSGDYDPAARAQCSRRVRARSRRFAE